MEMKIETVPSMAVLETLVKTEIDNQVATAKAFPRDLVAVKVELMQLVTQSVEVAELCSYALPRKQRNEKTGKMEVKTIQGPSVRFAEMVVYCYGNTRSGSRVIGNDGRKIKSQGFCHDLQKNNFNAIEIERKITTKFGAVYSEDMQIMTGNAASKIAFRNAVLTVVPSSVFLDAYNAAFKMSKGTVDTLAPRREKAIKQFATMGVTIDQLLDVLGIKTVEEIDVDKLHILSGMKASILNQEFSVEDLFPKNEDSKGKKKSDKATEDTLNMMNGKK